MNMHSHRFGHGRRSKKTSFLKLSALSIFFLCGPFIYAFADTGLKPGDQVPSLIIRNVQNYRTSTLALSGLKGKLVILDFWATWCSPCVKKMPEMDALQKKYGSKLQILLVTAEKEDKFRTFLGKKGYPNSLPFVIADTELNALFPHQFIPHYGWIGTDGKVLALTGPDDVNETNIKAAIAGSAINAISKIDMDRSKPLFSSVILPDNWIRNFSLLVKGYYPGLPSGTVYRKTDGIVTGIALSNFSMESLYLMAAHGLDKKFLKQQLLAELPAGDPWYTAASTSRADSTHSYSFELRVPPEKAKDLYQLMLDNLNLYSGYSAKFEKRLTQCFMMAATGIVKISAGKEGRSRIHQEDNQTIFTNVPVSGLVTRLNDRGDLKHLVVDETGFAGTTDLDLQLTPDVQSLNKQLEPYGLLIKEASREIMRLVITKN